MNEKQAFLAAIAANPNDATPRLVYADYLDEIGEGERAEFVRVQCALARGDFACHCFMYDCGEFGDNENAGCEPHRKGSRLRLRERELLGPSPCTRCDWHKGIQHLSGVQWDWSRGFVSHVRLPWQSWLAHADALTWHPGEKCRACGGNGHWRGYDETCNPGSCDDCSGTGFRPCPETVCPGLSVTITTPIQLADVQAVAFDKRVRYPDSVGDVFHLWPGLTRWAVDPAPARG